MDRRAQLPRLLVIAGLAAGLIAVPAGAQWRLPVDGGTTTSLGQPNAWLWSVGWAGGVRNQVGDEAVVVDGRLGVYHELLSRTLGLGGIQVELYGGSRETVANLGMRARFVSPFLRLGIGLDANAEDRDVSPVFSFMHPFRRGGVFRDGSVLRFDLTTGERRTFTAGLETPIRRRIPQGKTRRELDAVPLANRRPPTVPLDGLSPARQVTLTRALAVVRDAARQVQALCTPWLDHTGSGGGASDRQVIARLEALRGVVADALRSATATGEPPIVRLTPNDTLLADRRPVGTAEDPSPSAIETATRRMHAALDLAFSIAVAPHEGIADAASATSDPSSPVEHAGDRVTSAGRAVAERARAILLDEVLLPYDRLLGQEKDEDTVREFAVLARGAFVRWLHAESGVPREAVNAALFTFSELLEIVEDNRAATHRQWSGARFVWLPLQLALLPEAHDTQEELDALVAKAAGDPFTEGNYASYVINEQYQYQLSRTIHEARDYHVLLTHDFRGYDALGDPDEMSFRHVLRSYLAAITDRVRAYDSTGIFPTYLIILDEWFYDVNGGRLWMSLLENPLEHRVHLPPRFRAWEDSLALAQDSLRAAVAKSSLLTAQRRQYGEGWFHNLIKVHVNITNAYDPTFWSWRVASSFPVPDSWARDHRKLAFYDLSEDDPYRGEAIFTGAGIGEHYANLSWEDRSLLVRGPVLLGLKTATREVLLNQGIAANRIPAVLQPRPRAPDYDERVRRTARDHQRPLRALQLHNGTGFDAKLVNVAKAVLYTLMPPGSVIKIPDSLWNGTFWGSAMVGAALRGVRVLVIAPALSNAPARAFGSLIRSRELLWRLLAAARVLGPEIEGSGGLLKVGIFASDLRVTDIPGKVFSVRRTLERHQWLHDLFDFPPAVYPGLDSIARELEERIPARLATASDEASRAEAPPNGASGQPRREFESRDRSLLHVKANFFASREAWTVMAREDWVAMTRQFVQLRMAQVQRRDASVASFERFPDALVDVGEEVLQRWYAGLTPAARERVVFYTILGSHNQNDRSLTSDGEVALFISNWPSVIPYLDLISLVGQSDWIDDPAALDRYLPPGSWVKRRLAHWFKFTF